MCGSVTRSPNISNCGDIPKCSDSWTWTFPPIFGNRIEKDYLARRDDFFNVARRVVSAPVKEEVVSSYT